MRRPAVAILVSVCVLAGTAAADPPRRKSHQTAQWLSGGGAAISTGLVLSSFIINDPHDPYNKPLFYTGMGFSVLSPSAGEYYTGQYLTWGEAVRAGAVALAVVGATRTSAVSCEDGVTQCTQVNTTGVALLSLAAIAYVGGVFYDVLDAPDAVDRYNHKLRVQLVPGPMPTTFGPPGGGLFLQGRW